MIRLNFDKGMNGLLKENKVWTLLGIVLGLFLIYKLLLSSGIETSIAFAIFPICFAGFILILNQYRRIFYLLFASHFVLLIASSITEIRLGAITLIFNVIVLLLLILISVYRKTSWKDSWNGNGMLALYLIWGIYCIAELGNPNTVQEAWNIAITHYVVYPVICAILVPITIRRYKDIKWLLLLWSVFILLSAFKGYYQKNYGFNDKELYFLLELGGARTHIIWSGVRYFSFFTDAANYGVHMAMAILAFGISFFYVKNKLIKVYFIIVILAATYGMFISGTRTAIAVPLAGLLLFTVLSKNWKAFYIGLFVFLGVFIFFRFTEIGSGNQYIWKMRSAFKPKNDASFQARVINREKMKVYMADKPFGYGLGLGGKAERFKPNELMPIPPDSWLVNVWTDTGIVGFILYCIIHLVLFAWCSWILMFKLTNKRIRGLLTAWLCINAGFFVAAYGNDVMQYPNMIIIYTGFALCFAGPVIDKRENKQPSSEEKQI